MDSLYLSSPVLICFDGSASDADFTPEQQSRINAMLAENKRGMRLQLVKTERQLADLTESKNLSEQERESLAEALEETRSQLRTKEENDRIEKQKTEAKYKKEVDSHKKRADESETKLNNLAINYGLQDAAASEGAYNTALVVEYLRSQASVTSDGNVVVQFSSKDAETGKDIVEQLSPHEAVKRLKSEPEKYGGLFKEFVQREQNATPGKFDPAKLSTDEYMRLRRENPRALGL